MLAGKLLKNISFCTRAFSVTKSKNLCALPSRFYSSWEMVSRAAVKLERSLDKEIKQQSNNYKKIEDIENFLEETGFKYTE